MLQACWRLVVVLLLQTSLIRARIRSFVFRENALKNYARLTKERLDAHMEHLNDNMRSQTTEEGRLWALLNESYRISENYGQAAGGATAESPLEVLAAVQMLASRPRAEWRNVCEIGMNIGSSALLWLHGTDGQLQEFDMFERAYSNGVQDFLNAAFPNRTSFHKGRCRWIRARARALPRFQSSSLFLIAPSRCSCRSEDTLRELAKEVRHARAPPCDLWYIDGCHDTKCMREDMRHALVAASFDGWVMADDYSKRFPGVRAIWDLYEEKGLLTTVKKVMYMGENTEYNRNVGPKGWAIGRWNATALRRINHRLPQNCSLNQHFCEFDT